MFEIATADVKNACLAKCRLVGSEAWRNMVGTGISTVGSNPNDRQLLGKEAERQGGGVVPAIYAGLRAPSRGGRQPAEPVPLHGGLHDQSDSRFVALAAELCGALIRAGKPSLPEGKREEAIGLLTLLVIDPTFRERYVAVLARERDRIQIASHIVWPAREIPEEEIVRNGFGNLDDDTLADLAIDPAAIDILARVLTSVPEWRTEPHDVGEWFDRAAEREYGQRDS